MGSIVCETRCLVRGDLADEIPHCGTYKNRRQLSAVIGSQRRIVMARSAQDRRLGPARLAIMAGLFFGLVTGIAAQAQTFTVLHQFTGGADGSNPYSSLVFDRSGNLYGVAPFVGNQTCETQNGIGCGTVYKLAKKTEGWLFTPLYAFMGNSNGNNPIGSLAIAPDGTIYGTTDALMSAELSRCYKSRRRPVEPLRSRCLPYSASQGPCWPRSAAP